MSTPIDHEMSDSTSEQPSPAVAVPKNGLTAQLIDMKWSSAPGVIVTDVKTFGCGFGSEYVYCYTYPTYVEMAKLKQETRMRIKVGKADGDPIARIRQQTAGSKTALSEPPIVLIVFQTLASRHLERWLHTRLERVADSIGAEWFHATPEELVGLYREYLQQASSPVSDEPTRDPVPEAASDSPTRYDAPRAQFNEPQRTKKIYPPSSFAKIGPVTCGDDVIVFIRRHSAYKRTSELKSEKVRRIHKIEDLMENLGSASVQQLRQITGYSEVTILDYANWSILRGHSKLKESKG